MKAHSVFLACALWVAVCLAQNPVAHQAVGDGADYYVEKPGTITFTVGLTIKGKVEKPQVMIFLPKEKSFYRPMSLGHSFGTEIADPLPFVPVLE